MRPGRGNAGGDGGTRMSSGSQKRKTTARIAVNCTPEQKASIVARAGEVGLSPSAICLAMMLDAPLPRHRNPAINDQALMRAIAAHAKLADALRELVAALGKPGSNLNQVAYMLNANTAPARIINITESAIADHVELVAECRRTLETVYELRTMTMDAWGLEH